MQIKLFDNCSITINLTHQTVSVLQNQILMKNKQTCDMRYEIRRQECLKYSNLILNVECLKMNIMIYDITYATMYIHNNTRSLFIVFLLLHFGEGLVQLVWYIYNIYTTYTCYFICECGGMLCMYQLVIICRCMVCYVCIYLFCSI